MKNFFRSILITSIGFITSFFFILIFSLILIAIISPKEKNELKNNSILHLKFDQTITDQNKEEDFSFNLNGLNTKGNSLENILQAIENAKTDDKIVGIFLEPSIVNTGIATANEIRNKLQEFKNETKKFIISYSEIYSQKAYYISSVSNNIYMHPEGMLDLRGLSYNGLFFTEALERIGVEPQIIRHGKFKSAIEPFTRTNMSEENKKQTKSYMNDLWNNMLMEISESRNMNFKDLNKYSENYTLQSSYDAKKMMLIDSNIYKDQIINILKIKTNDTNNLNLIKISKYINYHRQNIKKEYKNIKKNKIAVLYASGDIVGGEDKNKISSEQYSKIIREIRKNKKIKALVIRINSPGGSALASETILREIILTKKEKPVIVSMGDIAASGGYYIACYADTIVCNPTTITGSIGVFGMMFNAKNMLNNKLGIYTDTVKTGEYADMMSIFRPMSNKEKEFIQKQIEKTYDTFITHVSKGRKIDKKTVNKIAQGRVWSGKMAKEIGLIDVLGGLETAINIASEISNIDNYEITSYPKQQNTLAQLTTLIESKNINKEYLNFNYENIIHEINKIDKIQARMPYNFFIN